MKRKDSQFAAALLALAIAGALAAPASARIPEESVSSGSEAHIHSSTQSFGREHISPFIEQPGLMISDADKPGKESPDSSAFISDFEWQVVELVNQERAAYSLAPLTVNMQLCRGAQLKSQDMYDSRYFDHNSPTYGTPYDMMRSLGISYAAAGENIAMGHATADAVVRAWLRSPGHRANILSANFTEIGVGYVTTGNYWTQWFIG